MAPAAVLPERPSTTLPFHNGVKKSASYVQPKAPLIYSGSLDHYKSFDPTNVIGRELPDLQLSDILGDDSKIRDLAILVSQRGVVFLRNQNLNIDDQKILGQKLGELTGKPSTSKLHKHALFNASRGLKIDEHGHADDEISIISSVQNRQHDAAKYKAASPYLASGGWHAGISFEPIPSDYAILKITEVPEDAGGDTLWASGYEAYDRLSPAFKTLAEGLTATHHTLEFLNTARKHNLKLFDGERGAPENVGLDFEASHPVVRTNPVTGWKSLYGAAGQLKDGWIDGVTPRESEILKDYFLQLIANNHDLQVRFRWGENDVAIWDNRSAFHTATNDYYGSRQGNRVVSLGEKPYYDPKSVSRREALGQT
ncbi:Alpha-ketoglutarate-dependent dioxygenase oryG [Fulvia fulva]|nr:Alpha-ketoglutarate-dependent dioxygenase oryG [Fulvia fulva]WPV15353.1 Alpha-ketoglutarate-dependent dioxygenase oryG [Fulvia fulva]WPV30387.1 Alpha-ketoglutarate-dependent dioxygenase oryG [Fulvia fulva]